VTLTYSRLWGTPSVKDIRRCYAIISIKCNTELLKCLQIPTKNLWELHTHIHTQDGLTSYTKLLKPSLLLISPSCSLSGQLGGRGPVN